MLKIYVFRKLFKKHEVVLQSWNPNQRCYQKTQTIFWNCIIWLEIVLTFPQTLCLRRLCKLRLLVAQNSGDPGAQPPFVGEAPWSCRIFRLTMCPNPLNFNIVIFPLSSLSLSFFLFPFFYFPQEVESPLPPMTPRLFGWMLSLGA